MYNIYSRSPNSCREDILQHIKLHPEGLTTKELTDAYYSDAMDYVKVRYHLRALLSGRKIVVVNPEEQSKVFIHKDYDIKRSIVDEFFRENNIPKMSDRYPQPEGMERASRYTILKLLETQFEPVSSYEIADMLGVGDIDSECQRIRLSLNDYVRRGLVKKASTDGVTGGISKYYIPYPSDKDRSEMINRDIPIGFLYSKYIRYKLELESDEIPYKEGMEIVKCISNTYEIGADTPKEINLKIRVFNNEKWVYSININNTNTEIVFRDCRPTINGEEPCIDYILCNMGAI